MILIILLGIFLTMPYARIGTNVIGFRIGHLIWRGALPNSGRA
ncbi:hypothetical protein [Microvirga sp. KLBC 81]|nr:hypothetical protein [Microvirga sp. KLBC 81]